MRKILAMLLTALLLFSLVSCGDEPTSSVDSSEDFATSDASSSMPEEFSDPITDEPDETDEPDTDLIVTTTTSANNQSNTSSTQEGTTTKKTTVKRTTTKKKTTTTKEKTTTTTKKTTTKKKATTTSTKKPTTTTTQTPTLPTSGNWEKPVTVNTAILYNQKSSSFDATAEARRQSILNAPDTLKASAGGKTYYISYRGDDGNNGLTKNTPWLSTKTLQVNYDSFKSGDVILFERGGVYRDASIVLPDGVSIGAYGSGPKPQLLGSERNYADAGLWKQSSTENVWYVEVPGFNAPVRARCSVEDRGNIIFDNGEKVASSRKKYKLSDVKRDFDFYYDAESNYVYLYYSQGNPGSSFNSIDICPNEHILRIISNGNHVVENLCLKYTSAHGVSAPNSYNVTIRGCEIGYIGGGLLRYDDSERVRFGNGIEFYGSATDHLVENNWIYQCYDAGYTNQGDGWHQNLTVKGNLIEYCPYNIEVWTVKTVGAGGMVNCTFEDNYLRFAGFGFSSYIGRLGSNTSVYGNISFYTYVVPCENTVIKNNVLDSSYRYLLSIVYPNDAQKRGPTITGNTWIFQPFSNSNSTASVGHTKLDQYTIHTATSQETLETSVKVFDLNPKRVVYEG